MTQHGTSVVIKQTNDALSSAERLLEMLQVVARDQRNQEKEKKAETSSIHSFSKQVVDVMVCPAGVYPQPYSSPHLVWVFWVAKNKVGSHFSYRNNFSLLQYLRESNGNGT